MKKQEITIRNRREAILACHLENPEFSEDFFITSVLLLVCYQKCSEMLGQKPNSKLMRIIEELPKEFQQAHHIVHWLSDGISTAPMLYLTLSRFSLLLARWSNLQSVWPFYPIVETVRDTYWMAWSMLMDDCERDLRNGKRRPRRGTRTGKEYLMADIDRLSKAWWEKRNSFCGSIKRFRPEIEVELKALRLFQAGIKRNHIGQRLFPQIHGNARLMRVSWALKRICFLVYGVELPRDKRKQRLIGFDPRGHSDRCLQCSSAKKVEGMCPPMQAFVNQDTHGLRE